MSGRKSQRLDEQITNPEVLKYLDEMFLRVIDKVKFLSFPLNAPLEERIAPVFLITAAEVAKLAKPFLPKEAGKENERCER